VEIYGYEKARAEAIRKHKETGQHYAVYFEGYDDNAEPVNGIAPSIAIYEVCRDTAANANAYDQEPHFTTDKGE